MPNLPDMRNILRFSLVAVLVAAAACSPLDRLKRAQENDRGDFRSHLAAEYLSFAESEMELGHEKTADHFARKGLRAAHAIPIPPEHPADWKVEGDVMLELRNSRERLMKVRSEFFQRVAGQRLARAQLFYDCWVMQAAERADDDLSLPCRGEFLGELGGLEQIVATLGPAPKVKLPADYTILFPLGGTGLDKNGLYTVQEVLAISRLYPESTIDITGHADRVGSRARNLVLSTERAANVAFALTEAGIGHERIGFSADGEDNPATPTLDGVARERNRRVEIRVLPLMAPPQDGFFAGAPQHEAE